MTSLFRRLLRLIRKTKYFTEWTRFKTHDGGRFLTKKILQRRSICWALAVVRHLTLLLKMKGVVFSHEALSIKELVQLVRKYLPSVISRPRYGLFYLDAIEMILSEYGLVLESENPLDYNFEDPLPFNPEEEPPFRFKIKKMEVVSAKDYDMYHFEKMLRKDLKKSPLACALKVFPLYESVGKKIFSPLSRSQKPIGNHVALLVAFGKRRGRYFYKFQESYGNRVGHRGFTKVAADRGIIRDYFRFDI